MKGKRPPVLLFDLGGVLVQWDGVPSLIEFTGGRLDFEEARKFWIHSEWVRRFEMGQCSPQAFAHGVVHDLHLAVDPPVFLEAFVSWDRGPLPGAISLMEKLEERFVLTCLSNNNEIHWPRIRDDFGFGRLFERAYLSHELRLVKPDPAIFDHVIQDLGIAPSNILFFDDNIECVEGARARGIDAELARGVPAVCEILRDRGLWSCEDLASG